MYIYTYVCVSLSPFCWSACGFVMVLCIGKAAALALHCVLQPCFLSTPLLRNALLPKTQAVNSRQTGSVWHLHHSSSHRSVLIALRLR